MENYSIIITCVNETDSLEKTLKILMDENSIFIFEIIIVYPKRVYEETLKIIQRHSENNAKVKLLMQTKPHVGGAVQDAFQMVSGEYTIMMSSDLETDPYDVKEMIKLFEKDKSIDLITASRWKKENNFKGYGKMRIFYNYIFNKLFALFYNTNLTDMTFGYRGFKTSIVKKIKWENYKHSFFFETIIKPINMGCNIKEIPTKWVAREDGSPVISRDYLNFIFIGLKNRFIRNK